MGSGSSSPREEVEEVDFVEPGTEERARADAEEAFERKIRKENDEAQKQGKERECQDLKEQLKHYEMGSKLSLSAKFSTPEIDSINIGLIGPTGSGKSSLIGLAQYLFQDKIDIETQDTGNEGTIHLQTYFDGNDFRIFDTRGFFKKVTLEAFTEIQRIINGEIKPGNLIPRGKEGKDCDVKMKNMLPSASSGEQPLGDRVHVLVLIVDIQDPNKHQYIESLKDLKAFCKVKGLETVCVFVSNEEHAYISEDECEILAGKAGVASDRVFKIRNHIALETVHEMSTDYDSQLNVLNVLDTAILAGERFLKFSLQREVNDRKKKAKRSSKTLSQIFEEVVEEHGLPGDKLHGFLSYLKSESVTTPNLLNESWGDLDARKLPSANVQRWIKQKLEA